MRKKKVLHLLFSDSYSGAEKVVCTIIENMKNNYDMIYCSKKGPIEETLKKKNISYNLVNNFTYSEIKHIINDFNPDIIHAHDYRCAFYASLCKNNRKLIIHIHNNNPWLKTISIKSFVFLLSIIKSNNVLLVSQSILDEYIFKKRLINKSIIINNPLSRIDIISKKSNDKAIKCYDICCVARLSLAKNPERFLKIIQMVSKNNKIKVVWVGDGELKSSIVLKSKEMGLDKIISFVGFTENPYQYLSNSKIFLLTSDWEGFGLSAFEALSLGLPSVVSNVGGLKKIVDESCGKLCDPDNIRSYSDEIEKLLNDSSYYKEKSKFAILKSKKLENLDKYINELDIIYKKLFKNN